MRAARPALVALIGVAAVLFAVSPALAATEASLSLSASHGAAGASVNATYSYPGSWGWFGPSCGSPVTFSWDGRAIAQARQPGWDNGTCSVSVTITPPSGASGAHTVKGSAPNASSAQATYTIDSRSDVPMSAPPPPPPAAGPTPEPIAGRPQRVQPSQSGRSAQPSRSARPTPSAGSPGPSAGGLPDPPTSPASGNAADPSGSGAALVAMDAPVVTVRPVASTPLGVWVLMAGGALILLGAALVGTVRLLRRKKRWAFSI